MKKAKESSSSTIIRDPRIEPYFISKDSHCYTIFETITPDTRYTENNKPGQEYIKALGHYSNFGNCLKVIARNKTNDKLSFDSITEYIATYRRVEELINELINIGI
jgi:hypothetical protein